MSDDDLGESAMEHVRRKFVAEWDAALAAAYARGRQQQHAADLAALRDDDRFTAFERREADAGRPHLDGRGRLAADYLDSIAKEGSRDGE